MIEDNNNINSSSSTSPPITVVRERTLSSSGTRYSMNSMSPNHRLNGANNNHSNSSSDRDEESSGYDDDDDDYLDTSSEDEAINSIEIYDELASNGNTILTTSTTSLNGANLNNNNNDSSRRFRQLNNNNNNNNNHSNNYRNNNSNNNHVNSNSNNNRLRRNRNNRANYDGGCCGLLSVFTSLFSFGKSRNNLDILAGGGGSGGGGVYSRKRNILCVGVTLLFIVSIFLILMVLMRVPVSYSDQEEYSDRILTSYCRFGFIKNSAVYQQLSSPSQLQTSCVFGPDHLDYECTPAANTRLTNYRYELEVADGYGGSSSGSGGNNINTAAAAAAAADPFSCQQPVVSVIVPIYNIKIEYLEEMILSLERQSLQSFEVLVVDDGSTETPLESFLRNWKSRDPRISIHKHSSNRGLSAARNTGIRHSRGDYLFFLDGDDQIEPTTLEKLAWKLESTPEIKFAKGLTVGFGAQNYTWNKGFEQSTGFLSENQVTATIMFRKDVFTVQGKSLTAGGATTPQSTPIFNGYDESIIGGMEDWDFLLRLAEKGYWGETIPEYLDWYRRKDTETSKQTWSNFNTEKKEKLIAQFKLKYPLIHSNAFPKIEKKDRNYQIESTLSFHNPIKKVGPRLLLILPWFNTGGADKFNLNLIKQLVQKGWEITIVATLQSNNPWLDQFKSLTSDIFILNNFLSIYDFPRFLCYLIESRRIDITMVTNSEIGYLFIPYIRERCPYSSIVDYIHMEENEWKNGGFARYSLSLQSQLDLSIVSSDHLKEWMIKKGTQRFSHSSGGQSSNNMVNNHLQIKANKQQEKEYTRYAQSLKNNIDVAYVNVDTNEFFMNLVERSSVRSRYSIPPGQTVILYAARLTEQKQPMVALEVFKDMILKNLSFTALVSGDGALREQMEEFVQRNGMADHVKLLGNVPLYDMPRLISASDIVFLPSKMEGIAMLFYEAMAAGVVPVGAKVGGQDNAVASSARDRPILESSGVTYHQSSAHEESRQELS
ncbi:putative glycosyltransferase [Heterostelium album PN500]|uniref:Putative glycosyltransferase n=1 Tax=Heterostelium pallidum (strain ATCC 26659 / Pp 5 / PN500) TaxID=670386 RepID=D3BGJ9_HETP5|nr:putative glycosyltransferase [Heterostelium album PN500]EFA79233.1 putative glycosyltransferase [Heterostelium album PN500]|eukprot:XP_020431354.1 putative glycosyltransferase [Heterostelium album PN500]